VRRTAGAGAGLFLSRGAANALAAVRATARDNVRHYVSRPDLRPAKISVLHAGKTGDGYLFLAPSSGAGQRGVLIMDNTGDVVWFHPTTPHTAMNFRRATYRGEPVLTWWEGKAKSGLGQGTHVIVDASYREIERLPAGRGRQSDLHEFLITPRNTALVTSYEVRPMDLTAVGGPVGGKVIGGIVQELALPSRRVLFEWRSLDHVAVEETHAVFQGHPLDYFHINSIELTHDGNLLVSARNTWGVYKVNRRTGDVMWRLGGKRSDFAMGKGTTFAWQHDARQHGPGLISIFDDGAAPQVETQSRVIVIGLDGKRGRARLVRKYTHHPGRLVTQFMGNAQVLGNGNIVVGWGSEPFLTEFAPDGSILFDARLPDGGMSYRAFRFPWTGQPASRPALAARLYGSGHILHASWNGATEVASWQLQAGLTPAALAPAPNVARTGFETELTAPETAHWANAVALDRHGKQLGRSKTLRLRR
jgi:hypothetical protein